MKRLIILICFLTILQTLSAGHHTADSVEENPVSGGLRLAVFGDLEKWDILSDFTMEYRGDDPFYTAFSAGAYYRLHRNLKGGIFYTLQSGALHDEDWIQKGSEEWQWDDTSDRFEHLISVDLTPRFLLPFLPGRNWTISFKNRYTINLNEEMQSYELMPLLNWFWLRAREPVLNTSLGYGLYFPLNFSDSLLYKHGPWFSLIYHISDSFKAELRARYLRTNWTVVSDQGNESVSSGSAVVTLGLIWIPGIIQ